MEQYTPPFTITNTILELTAVISEKVGLITSRRELESMPHLRKNNRIKSIHSSLKIEANSLSLSEVRDVINGHFVLGDLREIQEVKNTYAAYECLKDYDPYSLADLKKAHARMTQCLIEESGMFRRGNERVFSGNQCIFVAPPPTMVPALMQDLFDWMGQNRNTVHPLVLSAVFHYEFVFIHPFSDGNGRVARLWHTVLLSNWRDIFAYIPLESQIEKFQSEYYDAIAQCHKNGDSTVFIEFMLTQISHILDEAIAQIGTAGLGVSEYVKRMLAVMEYDVPYTASAIMEKLGLKSKETFRRNYMTPALEEGLLEMTIPDKPQSRNQRYVKR